MIARASLRGVFRWRSTQLYDALICPPRNHSACGGFQFRTRSHGRDQSSWRAISTQNASGSRVASRYSSSVETRAAARKSSGGGNFRFSWRRTSMSLMEGMSFGEAQDYRVLHAERQSSTFYANERHNRSGGRSEFSRSEVRTAPCG